MHRVATGGSFFSGSFAAVFAVMTEGTASTGLTSAAGAFAGVDSADIRALSTAASRSSCTVHTYIRQFWGTFKP